MADKKISQLGATSTPADPDLYAIVQSGTTKKITHANLKAAILNSANLTAGVVPYWDGTSFADSPLLITGGEIILSSVVKSPDSNTFFALFGSTNGGTIAHHDGTIDSTLLADSATASISWSNGSDSGNVITNQSRVLLSHTAIIELDAPAYQYTQLTASTVPYLDASKNLVSSGVTPTALGYIGNLTSDAQAQISALVTGLFWKSAVRAATTTAGTLASDFENGDTLDGVVLSTGDRILIKNQASAVENGIYVVNASGAPTRSSDFDSGSDNLAGATVAVQEGTINADLQFVCSTNAPITIGVSNINFVLVGGTTYIGTANRITVTGNVIDIGTDVVTLTGSQALSNKTGNISQWTNDSNYLRCVAKKTTDSSTVTGTTSTTMLDSMLIPAGSVSPGHIIEIMDMINKTGNAGTMNHAIHINTSASLSGATQLGITSVGATGDTSVMARIAVVKSSTLTVFPNTTSGQQIRDGVNTGLVSNLNIDWTIDQYIISSGQLASAADVMKDQGMYLFIH